MQLIKKINIIKKRSPIINCYHLYFKQILLVFGITFTDFFDWCTQCYF